MRRFYPKAAPHNDVAVGSPRVIECLDCGFRHLSPLPDLERINALYEEEYYTSVKGDYAAKQSEERAWWHRLYARRINRFKDTFGQNLKILDIGCGPGNFLETAEQLGCQVVGLEPSRHAVKAGLDRGLNILQGWPDAETLGRLPKVNIVQIDQAIEHALKPHELLYDVANFLDPGSAVSVIFANDFSPLQEAAVGSLGLNTWWVEPSEHLNYFDTDSMTRLLERHGFEVNYIQPTFPIDIFLLFGINYVESPIEGPVAHRYRKAFEKAVEENLGAHFLDTLYSKLGELGIGREVEIVATLK
jgi:SAM-dependent methyltransferase